jgi:hypothetical protein
MAHRMPRFIDHGEDFREIDFRRRLAVVLPERLPNLVAAAKQRIVETLQFLPPLLSAGVGELFAPGLLLFENPVDVR